MNREKLFAFPAQFTDVCEGIISLLGFGGFSYTLYSFLTSKAFAWHETLFIVFLWVMGWVLLIGMIRLLVKAIVLPFSALIVSMIDLVIPQKYVK